MAIYVIADLHLSFSQNKPMDIFGNNLENHAEKLGNNWIKKETRKITVFESLFLWDILNQEIRYGLHFFTKRST